MIGEAISTIKILYEIAFSDVMLPITIPIVGSFMIILLVFSPKVMKEIKECL